MIILIPKFALFTYFLILICSGTTHAKTEWVLVTKTLDNDDKAIIVRSNGEAYLIEKGTGCLSLWRYEGKKVLISSPGLFLGVGSKLIIPELGQECRIWDYKELGFWEGNKSHSETNKNDSDLSEYDLKIIQIGLIALGYLKNKLDSVSVGETAEAIIKFQKDNELKIGNVDPYTIYEMATQIIARYDKNEKAYILHQELLKLAVKAKNSIQSDCIDGHWINTISNDGEIIVLEDGSIWQVDPLDIIYTSLWLPIENVIICGESLMINSDNGEKARVIRIK